MAHISVSPVREYERIQMTSIGIPQFEILTFLKYLRFGIQYVHLQIKFRISYTEVTKAMGIFYYEFICFLIRTADDCPIDNRGGGADRSLVTEPTLVIEWRIKSSCR